MENMTEQEIRIDKIRKEMRDMGADACLITSNVNMYYATGQVVAGYLYIPAEQTPVLFVRRPVGLSGEQVEYVYKPEQIPEILAKRGLSQPECLMLEGDTLSHGEWVRYEAVFNSARMVNGTQAIRKARSVKTAAEIELIRQSGIKHAEVYRKIPELYQSGMTDMDLSVLIEHELRRSGHLGMFRVFGQSMEIFMGSILAGDNAGEPSPYDFGLGGRGLHPSNPVGADNTPLRKGVSVMVDMGGNFTGYMTDMTRTYSIGRLTDKAYYAHQTALAIQDEIARMLRPGTVCEDIYNRSLEIAKNNNLDECFMGLSQQARFVGHGVGIEVNELPVLGVRSRMEIEAGMVLAIEPKFIIKGVGAVGIENTFAVTENGGEKLTVLDEEIIDLEG